MRFTVLGSGDAFGSGGRWQTCFHVETGSGAFLIDCGVTSIMGLERAGLAAERVSEIYITHLHGDHFGGLPWWLIHAQHVMRRTVPLTVVGPPGLEARFRAATDALYPGALAYSRKFELRFVEIAERTPTSVGNVEVTAYEVQHPSGAPSYGLRLSAGSGAGRRIIGFSGDTEWVDALEDVARGADLFIAECYGYDEANMRAHMTWRVIEAKLPRLEARRILLTHMGRRMIAHESEVRGERVMVAADGMIIDL